MGWRLAGGDEHGWLWPAATSHGAAREEADGTLVEPALGLGGRARRGGLGAPGSAGERGWRFSPYRDAACDRGCRGARRERNRICPH